MWPFKKPEARAETVSFEDPLLQAILGKTGMTKEIALQIPTVYSAIDLISGIVASTPIKLYKLEDGAVVEVKDDDRTALLNDDTKDTLNAREFLRAIISDYYLGKGGYAYINRKRARYASVNYVDEAQITINKNTDPIFKDFDILVNGQTYKPYDFIKILRNSKDGASGTGIVTENAKILEVAYASLVFERNLVKKGGNKKGFFKSAKKLDDIAFGKLKAAAARLYSDDADSENFVVLNDGVDFKESSNTSVEMQLNENKVTNAVELCKIFHVSPDVIAGKATEADMQSVAKLAAIPLMGVIQCALNRDFLLEKEKKLFYWAFDIKQLLKGSFKDRMEAYRAAIDAGMMTPEQGRYEEDWPKIDGLNIIRLGLADVIYDVDTKTFFTPNTKLVQSMTGPTKTEPQKVEGSNTG
jgi:HK97 family phage portal protein